MYPLIKRRKAEDEGGDAPPVRQLHRFEAANTLLRNEGAALLKEGLSSSLHTLNPSFNPGISDWSFLGCLTSLTHLDISLNAGFTDQVRPCALDIARNAFASGIRGMCEWMSDIPSTYVVCGRSGQAVGAHAAQPLQNGADRRR